MLVRSLDRAAEVVTGVPPWSSSTVPPWPLPSALGSAIGPAKWLSRFARSRRSYHDDVTAGGFAVDEQWPRELALRRRLCFDLADRWVHLTSGSLLSAIVRDRIGHLIQVFDLFCEFCIFSLVAPKMLK